MNYLPRLARGMLADMGFDRGEYMTNYLRLSGGGG